MGWVDIRVADVVEFGVEVVKGSFPMFGGTINFSVVFCLGVFQGLVWCPKNP